MHVSSVAEVVEENRFDITSSHPIDQPKTTHTGAPIQPVPKGLPKQTQSICPECLKVIDARIIADDGHVFMDKVCPEHGEFRDRLSSDIDLYLKMDTWTFGDGQGLTNPAIPNATVCPEQCGLCNMHSSHTGLANVDLTNRCNLNCPVCFANANHSGYLFEPNLEQIRKMLQALRNEKPVAGRVVQFSGGEPTIHPNFMEVLSMAREMGFSHIQAATNGLMFCDPEFALKAKEAGLHTLYLQLDGVTDDIYRKTRGEDLAEKKLEAIRNCRKADLKIVFVPTIVKGLNDHQVGDIVRLALENIDVVSGISFQPVAFTGRISKHERNAKRYTLSDLAYSVESQTGLINAREDWFPLSCTVPFSKLISALRGDPTIHFTCHPQCAMGTYFFVNQATGEAVPASRFIDIGGMLTEIDRLAKKTSAARIKLFTKVQVWNTLRKHFHEDKAPTGLTFNRFLQTLQGMTDKNYGRGQMDGQYTYKTLMVAGMHFMDGYNYDVERVKRCLVHYAAPNGLLYPFCTYNAGPTFRERIEKHYSVPFEKQQGGCQMDFAGICQSS
jgi:7,8-dihydro-6-hydroxymethylpterin dimethyltransferase